MLKYLTTYIFNNIKHKKLYFTTFLISVCPLSVMLFSCARVGDIRVPVCMAVLGGTCFLRSDITGKFQEKIDIVLIPKINCTCIFKTHCLLIEVKYSFYPYDMYFVLYCIDRILYIFFYRLQIIK